MSDSQDWLDTETQAILSGIPPRKLAPARAAGFSLVMLVKGTDPTRTIEALRRIPHVEKGDSPDCMRRACPFVVANDLAEADAFIGQFELISADSVSVFIQDEVVRDADPQYMADLYASLLKSPEFEKVRVLVKALPPGYVTDKFRHQFLGEKAHESEFQGVMYRKKARIMRHWGLKIGASVNIEDVEKNV